MSENKTLLSQGEIDALVAFLTNSEAAPIGTVLDQSSIDKLIELVKYNNKRGLFIGEGNGEGEFSDAVVLDKSLDLEEQKKDYEIICRKDARDFVEILCVSKTGGKTFKLTPSCLLQNKRVEDDKAEWGLAISPLHFNNLALLFGIKYSSETFRFVCSNFAKVMYGYEDAEISSLYFPPEDEIAK
ncbi:MAG: hypothetical protein K6F63_04460 [Lachnospiraceae bacterium]|nr:hypothetical protein [Lachnospiraceae bacterium]